MLLQNSKNLWPTNQPINLFVNSKCLLSQNGPTLAQMLKALATGKAQFCKTFDVAFSHSHEKAQCAIHLWAASWARRIDPV
jgi:hypothetical protein